MSPDDQQAQLDALLQDFPHHCSIIASPMKIKRDLYNCFMFALNLHDNAHAQQVTDKRNLPLDHLPYLVQEGGITLLESPMEPVTGDVVYYVSRFDGRNLPVRAHHAGLVSSVGDQVMITSKWGRGNGNCIWLHPLEEVPATYEDANNGITAIFFRPDREKLKAIAKKTLEEEIAYHEILRQQDEVLGTNLYSLSVGETSSPTI